MAQLVFTPSGRRGRFQVGTNLLEAARQLGVDISSICGGRSLCGRCQVQPEFGEFAKYGISATIENLSSPSFSETDNKCKLPLKSGRRLACMSRLQGDMVIDVPADSQVHRQIVRKRAETHPIDVHSPVSLHYVEVEKPGMENPVSDLARIRKALADQWDLKRLHTPAVHVLSTLQHCLRKADFQVTVAVRNKQEIVALWPGLKDRVYGLAVDVGSTTIAGHLCDLGSGNVVATAGCMNPQIRFGEDLMSRVSYVMMNPDGFTQMTTSVRTAINDLTAEVCNEIGIHGDDLLELVLVGNSVMHHLLLAIDPVELGGAPFALALDESVTCPAQALSLTANTSAQVYVLPCIAGHVGADAAAMLLSEAPYKGTEMSLLVDVGTNAEIILGNQTRLLAASSPTGPAFEGAQISCGQRAAPGAIERVRIDPQTLQARFRIIGCELWSNEEGFAEASAETGVTGICGSGIIEAIAEMYLAGIVSTDGVINGHLAKADSRVRASGRTFSYLLHAGVPNIEISQNDVRQIQLAKAALYAGIHLLMDKMQLASVDSIRLAGAFGSHIDVKYAMVLGMIPDCPLQKVSAAGNAAGTGARIALLDSRTRREIEKIVRQVEKIETAVEGCFQEYFVDAMAIPHKRDVFSNLATVVDLPIANAADNAINVAAGDRRRRHRRR